MKKYTNKILILTLLTSVFFFGCTDKEEPITPSNEALFPELNKSEYDIKLEKMYAKYNLRVEYRYKKNLLPSDWYAIAPIKEELIIPFSEFLLDYWIKPMELSSSESFIRQHMVKKIVLIGSKAFNKDGSVTLGTAEGGSLIRFTECNDFTLTDKSWLRRVLNVAYHEYGHILHMNFILPDEYREVTPNNYTRNGWQTVNTNEKALKRGMISGYGTKSVHEDFVELFSRYITLSEKDLAYFFEEESMDGINDPVKIKEITERNEGRKLLEQKLNILKRFLENLGFDLVKNRRLLQEKLQ